MSDILEDLKTFLDTSPTAWHAATQLGNRLASQDFLPLDETEKWELEKGKKYFVMRGASLCAFSLPKTAPKTAVILGAHTDSPSLKIKPHQFQKENMTLFGVEVYGGPLLSSWLNRDLGIAGRIVIAHANGEIEEKLVFIDDAPLFIPQLAIHLDREVNEKGLILNKQEHLAAVATVGAAPGEEGTYLETLLHRYFSFQKLLSFDLFLVPLEKSRFLGSSSEFLASHGLDNRVGSHACAAALTFAEKPQKDMLQMAIFWDNEEIGSHTSDGAASPFLSDVLKRITQSFSMNEEDLIRMKRRSLCASVDMVHALNPNYAAKHDPQHQVLMGKGSVLKYNANYKYASSALTGARIIKLCEDFNLKHQTFVCRSDIPCGSTVGPIVACTAGIPTVDIGCPQLSMHSIREVLACSDYVDLCVLLTHLVQNVPSSS